LAALVASASVTPTPTQVAEVRALLSPIEDSPNYASIRKLPHARAAFEAISRDESVPVAIRGRALEGIASFGDADAFARVSAAVGDSTSPALLRRSALLALGIHFQIRALPVLERVLAFDQDVQLRRVAAITLARIHLPEAADLAKRALAAEREEVVRADLALAVQPVDARRPAKVRGAR
jgi:HEAT repeat protein